MHKRPIVNTRDEPHADPAKYRRLHGIVGDANMSEYATALKVGTTALVIELIEQRLIPKSFAIANPIDTIKLISHDQTYRWMIQKVDGKMMSAIDHQREYLALAQEHLAHQSDETDWVLTEWEETLNALEDDPMRLTDRLDWVAKKWLLETFVDSEGIEWDDLWLQSIDLEYHNINLEDGLFYGLQMQRIISDEQVHTAMHTPPLDTRAYFRGKSLNKFEDAIRTVQWDSITFDIEGKAVTVNMNSLANPEIAQKYNEALDLSPTPQTLVEKLGLN